MKNAVLLGFILFAAHFATANENQNPKVIERFVGCRMSETGDGALQISYKFGFGIEPKIDLELSGNTGIPPWPGGHTRSVGPVAFNGSASCGDRSQFCDLAVDETSPINELSKFHLSAPDKFIAFINGNMITIAVNTSNVGDKIHGKIIHPKDSSLNSNLVCQVKNCSFGSDCR